MKDITQYLKEKYSPWGWLGQRAHDAEGINRVLPLDFIISCSYGQDTREYFREKDVYCIEKSYKIRKDWSNEDLKKSFQENLGKEIFKRFNSYNKEVNLLCYRSLSVLELDTKKLKHKPRIFASTENIKTHFDNKTLLHNALGKLALPRVPGQLRVLGKTNFNSLRKQFSLPFVVQFPYGSSGHFTFIIKKEKDLISLKETYSDQQIIVSKFIDGFSLNVNGIVITGKNSSKTFCTYPSLQIIGAAECSWYPTAFCGNDFTSTKHIDKKIIKQIEIIVKKIGEWMAGYGFRGIFGMDFVVENGKVYPVEINPRFQNSTSLFTSLENREYTSKNNRLFLLHISEFLKDKDKVLSSYIEKFPYEELMRPVEGAQLVIHNNKRRNIVGGSLKPGIYELNKDKMIFKKNAASITECSSIDDLLITCAVPKTSTIIEPNAPICKMQFLGSALEKKRKKELSPEIKKAISCVYKKLELKEANRLEKQKA
jgi:predicted ATP-grasp superfamily ATP-dependent carboligase